MLELDAEKIYRQLALRARETFVTPAGTKLLKEVAPSIDAAEDAFLAPLGARERADFERMLASVSGMDTVGAVSH